MKINIEIDLSPEEARAFFGLPDVKTLQQQMLKQFSKDLDASTEKRDELVRSMFDTAMEPWQLMGRVFGQYSNQDAASGAAKSTTKKKTD